MEVKEKQEAKLRVKQALPFFLAGNATFTLRSLKTGTRYTYKVVKAEAQLGKPNVWFVKYLTGSDNDNDYSYIGIIKDHTFKTTAKSKLGSTASPVVAFTWTLGKLVTGEDLPNLEIWHAGTCGRCGRTLTVPESIEMGFGPECATRI